MSRKDVLDAVKSVSDNVLRVKGMTNAGPFGVVSIGAEVLSKFLGNMSEKELMVYIEKHQLIECPSDATSILLKNIESSPLFFASNLADNTLIYQYEGRPVFVRWNAANDAKGFEYYYHADTILSVLGRTYAQYTMLELSLDKERNLDILTDPPAKARVDYSDHKAFLETGRSILFYGPPGSGKTSAITSYLRDTNQRAVLVSHRVLTRTYHRTVTDVIGMLGVNAVVLDDIDHANLASDRLIEFLDTFKTKNIRVFSTANNINALSTAVLRPERLGLNRFYLGGDENTKLALFLSKAPLNKDGKPWDKIVLLNLFRSDEFTNDYVNSLADLATSIDEEELIRYAYSLKVADSTDVTSKRTEAEVMKEHLLEDFPELADDYVILNMGSEGGLE